MHDLLEAWAGLRCAKVCRGPAQDAIVTLALRGTQGGLPGRAPWSLLVKPATLSLGSRSYLAVQPHPWDWLLEHTGATHYLRHIDAACYSRLSSAVLHNKVLSLKATGWELVASQQLCTCHKTQGVRRLQCVGAHLQRSDEICQSTSQALSCSFFVTQQ